METPTLIPPQVEQQEQTEQTVERVRYQLDYEKMSGVFPDRWWRRSDWFDTEVAALATYDVMKKHPDQFRNFSLRRVTIVDVPLPE